MASMGLNLAADHAGNMPAIRPTSTDTMIPILMSPGDKNNFTAESIWCSNI